MAPLPANGSADGASEASPLLPPPSAGSLAIFSITFLLGFPGNGLVIWAIALKMKRTVNTVWFLHLAIADFVCCLSLPFSIAQLALGERWPFGWLLCKVLPSAVIFNMFASVFLLTAISLDRCLLVTKPVWCQNHRTARLASAICGVIWVLAFLLCCPSFFYRDTLEDESGNTRCINNWGTTGGHEDYQWFDDLWDAEDAVLLPTESAYDGLFPGGNPDPQPSYHPTVSTTRGLGLSHPSATKTGAELTRRRRPVTVAPFTLHGFPGVHPSFSTASIPQFQDQPADDFPEAQPPGVFVSATVARAVLGFLLPFVVMAACYALIARRMLAKVFAGPRRRALQLILLVVATFFLCWAPYHVTGVLFLLAPPQSSLHQALLWWDSVSVALAYANSCLNPLLYVFVGRQFRRKVCQTVQEVLEGAFAEGASSPVSSQDKRQTTTMDDEVDVSVL
ncbi:C3a anaphylatoxin chemotactic receptor-like [Thamnophis elegans]|uniref:C3a anaphylatoxin chemotactic receptor-like n=1 Tax=Thamnophis elegans TaxID=35005 RepID=UPI001377C574|nr:C3a anaphylatoxin chemotactic receptor-like [Thamnophis elegans]XP_032080620.1 C3a anaphylatoxin chemotactic receptor-like [Thamnophis elegans]